MDLQSPFAADRDFGAGGDITAETHLLRKTAINAARRRLAPANVLGNGIEDSKVLGMIRHELATKLERVLAGRVRKLIHEAFQINRILIVVHSAPEVRWDMRVAHRVVDKQVRNRIAERTFRTARIKTLEHSRVLAVL